MTLHTARSYKRDYCKIVDWTFSEWNNFRLEFADYCNEPPTKLVPKDKDYYEFLIEETADKTFISLKNINGIQDKFEIIELTEIKPIDNGNEQFNYSIELKRIK